MKVRKKPTRKKYDDHMDRLLEKKRKNELAFADMYKVPKRNFHITEYQESKD